MNDPKRGEAITIIPEPENTILYKFGYHDGKTGKKATIPIDVPKFYSDAYILGYARGYEGRTA